MNCSRKIHLLLALLVTLTFAQLPDCNSGISPTDLIQTGISPVIQANFQQSQLPLLQQAGSLTTPLK